MNAMTKTKPMFEVGKTYRTRQGWFVKIREIDEGSTYPLGGMFDRLTGNRCWTRDGKYLHYSDFKHEHDLMPGAIEDEKPEGRSTPYTNEERLDEAYRRIEGQTSVIAGMAAKIEAQQDQLNRHATQISNQREKLGKFEAAAVRDSEEHAQHIGTLQEAQIKTFARLDHHNIRLPTPDEQPTKRTIKGGWVNVYDYGHRILHISPVIFKTRQECECEGGDHRIACIQIPDITEGEGL